MEEKDKDIEVKENQEDEEKNIEETDAESKEESEEPKEAEQGSGGDGLDFDDEQDGEDGELDPEAQKREKLPLWSKIFYIIAAVAALVFIVAIISPTFADFYNRYIGSVVRGALAYITGWIPFSLAEGIIILIPVLAVVMVVWANKRYADTWRQVLCFIGMALSIASLFFSLFALGFGTGYHGTGLDEKLGLEKSEVSAQELKHTAEILIDIVNENAKELNYSPSGQATMPYSYNDMSARLVLAYAKLCDTYDFVPRLNSRVKPVMLSEPWTYTHIAGVYTYFTGEANINTNFPDYTLPFTAAHEMAHQRGMARENEANFIAFLVCMQSDDAYIRYSGALNLYEYVANALYVADKDAYVEVNSKLSAHAKMEMAAYSVFFTKYANSTASTVTGAVNDTFLKLQGTEGRVSYGFVVDIAVAYFKDK
jgi:hypothetical protein